MKKKKTLVLCLCAVLAASSLVGTSVMLTGCDNTPESSTQSSFEFSGTYYADVNGSECLFEMQDNAFTWTVGTNVETGTYEYDGKNSLVVKFDGESGVSAKIEDGVITITRGDVKYTFYEKVTYTVTLSTGDTVSVVNGKQLEIADEPTSADKKFVGWYKDPAYKIPYDFSEIVRSSFSLYARFETPSATEYEAELIVDGEVYGTAQTVGGVLYAGLLPTPEKEGATFVGWWTSDYSDATKLTEQCVETKIEEPVKLYAVWASNAPLVTVTSSGISWTTSKSGSQISLKITPPAGDPVEKTLKASSYEYDFTTRAAGDYIIEVTADGVTGKAYYQNKGLAKISVFNYEGSVLTWNEISNATKYLVSVQCGDAGHSHVEEEVTTNSYDFSRCAMKADGIQFTVKAVADGYVSSVSDTYAVVKNLAAVEGLAYDATTAKFTWTAVDNATSYKVKVNGEEYVAMEAVFDAKAYGTGDLSIEVTPVAFGFNSPNATTATATKASLAAPTGVKLSASVLSWNAVASATGYVVTIDGKAYDVTGTSFDLLDADNIAADAKSCSVTVKAVGATEEENSMPSNAVTVSFGTMADTLVYEAGKVKWDPVMNVQKYEVRINGGTATEIAPELEEAAIVFVEDGENVIEVRCYDQAGVASDWVSVKVDVYEVTFDYGVSLDKEDPVYVAAGDTFKLPDTPSTSGYDFKGWFNAATNGAEFTENVVTFNPENGDVVYAQWKAKTYKLNYILNGSKFSQTVTYDAEFSLPAPELSDDDFFGGWWTEANGQGIQYTDEQGQSIGVWKDTQDVTVYACTIELFEYVEVTSVATGGKGWSVKAGADIGKVSEIKIPAYYNGLPVVGIESMAFANCGNLTKISMPDTMETIYLGLDGPYNGTGSAFYKCSLLEAIEVYKVDGKHEVFYESIDGALVYNNAYNGRELVFVPFVWKLDEYRIPDGITTLPTNLFKSYTGLKKIIIPTSVTNIDSGVFYSCKVEEIVFETADDAKPLVIGAGAFKYCDFKTITLPARMAQYENETNTLADLFYYCDELLEINVEEGNEYYSSENGYLYNAAGDTLLYVPRGLSGDIKIPSGARKIASWAFGYSSSSNACQWITSVEIPRSVMEIGAEAFKYCTSLSSVKFLGEEGDPAMDIGKQAFYNTILNSLTLPANTGKVSTQAFGAIRRLTTVTVEAGEGFSVETGAFANLSGEYFVSTVYLGKNVPVFDVNGAFGPTKLARIYLDEDNTNLKLDDGVLFDYNVTQKNVTQIVYYPATKTGDYKIPETIKIIGGNVFNGKSLSTVNIPFTVQEIGDGAFANCVRLTAVNFLAGEDGATHPGLKIGAQAFQNDVNLAKLVLPSYTISIGAQAFESCEALTGEFVVPEGVTTIGDAAFRYASGIETISLPATLTTLEKGKDGTSSSYPEYYRTFVACSSLEAINVASKNSNFASEDGILYQLTEGVMTDLIICPSNYSLNDGKAVIKGTVRTIWMYAFSENVGLKEVSFATPVLTKAEEEAKTGAKIDVQKNAFRNATALQKVVFGTGVTAINDYTFYGCSSLEYVFIPNTVSTISSVNPFYKCDKLTDIIFEEGNTSNTLTIAGGTSYAYTGSAAFGYLKALETITFPERTDSIAHNAFVACPKLKEVYFPSTVKTIGNYIFGDGNNGNSYATGCPLLTKVVIAQGDGKVPLTIGDKAFIGTNLVDFVLPARTTKIGATAFKGSSIDSITIPKGVTSIGNYAFQYCTNLKSVTFEEGSTLKTIGQYAFASCAFKSIEIPASVETIDKYAFAYTENTSSITFASENSALKAIKDYAFRQSGITSLTLPESSNSITLGVDLFQYCTKLESVHLSSSVTTVGDTFGHCGSLTTVTVSSENQNFKVDGAALYNANGTAIKYLFDAATTDEEGVYRIVDGITEIGEAAFRGQVGIKKLYIPASVKTIGKSAFRYCVNLEEIIFESENSQLTTIGDYAFEGCTSLKSVVLPSTVNTLKQYAFASCTSLESVQMSGVTTLSGYAFYQCSSLASIDLSSVKTAGKYDLAYTGLTSVNVPATLNSGTYMFTYCTQLSEVKLNNGLTALGGYTFYGCTALQSINVPSTVGSFGNYVFAKSGLTSFTFTNAGATPSQYMFYQCTSLRSVKLIEGMTQLSSSMFRDCTSLGADAEEGEPSVVLPTTLTTVQLAVFKGCTSLKFMEFHPGITEFGDSSKWGSSTTSYLFQDCTSLEKVVLPATLEKIATGAFQGCTSLTTIENLESVEVVYSSVFRNTGLTSISLPAVTSLGSYSFADNAHLEKVELNDDLSVIPYCVFQNCTKLKTIQLPSKLGVLGSEYSGGNGIVFQGCTALEEIVIPKGIAEVRSYMFEGCTNLKKVTFQGAVSMIEEYAFANCTSLTDFEWTEFLISIGDNAFENSGLTTVAIPTGTTTIGTMAFGGCENLATFTIDENNPYYTFANGVLSNKDTGEWLFTVPNYAADNGKLTITNDSDWKVLENASPFAGNLAITEIEITADWKELPAYLFYGMANLEKVTLPASMESIGDYAFAGCSKLSTINLPASLTYVGEYAFNGCAALTEVTLPAALEEIGEYAFEGTKLTTVEIPASVKTVNRYAFYGIETLTSLTLNEGLETVGGNAFAGTGITSVTVPASVKTFGSWVQVYDVTASGSTVTSNKVRSFVFADCTSLTKVTFLGTAVELTGSTFKGCTALTEVILPEGLLMIEDYMFYGCTALESVKIPSTVQTIGGFAFAYSGIKSIEIPANVTCIGGHTIETDPYQTGSTTGQSSGAYWEFLYPNGHVFMGCTKLTEVKFLGDLEQIGWYAFEGCTALETITLPDSIEIIGDYAFANCTALTKLNVPANAMFIGNYAFANTAIESLVIPATTIVYNNAFEGWTESQVINAELSEYKAWSIWNLTWYAGSEAKLEWNYKVTE